ncbi:hypothetical protein DFS33DRAFT_968487 [Desarmillaria ectypa]|nr:hypothetical protein DFS33DRAFT_968487 [Desarmillaria ectypa]
MADVHVLLDAKKPMKQESTDLTGSDSGLGSDDDASSAYQNIFMSRNNDRTLSACSTTASAIDVTHLFDFSEEDFVPGPAYMDEDEDSDATNWDVPGIFHSPLHSPLPRTPNCSEKYSLRPRPRPSENNAPSYSEPPAKRCKRANKENHGNGEENPGWREAYNMLLKEYTHLQREYDMLKESVEMERRVEQGQGQGLSRSPSHLTYVTNRGVSLLGGTGHTNQQSYVSNVYSLLS